MNDQATIIPAKSTPPMPRLKLFIFIFPRIRPKKLTRAITTTVLAKSLKCIDLLFDVTKQSRGCPGIRLTKESVNNRGVFYQKHHALSNRRHGRQDTAHSYRRRKPYVPYFFQRRRTRKTASTAVSSAETAEFAQMPSSPQKYAKR